MHLSIILHVNTVTLLAEQNNLVQSHSTASSHCIVNVVVNALKKIRTSKDKHTGESLSTAHMVPRLLYKHFLKGLVYHKHPPRAVCP